MAPRAGVPLPVPNPCTSMASKAIEFPPDSRRSMAGASSPTIWTSVAGRTTFSYRRISIRLVASSPKIHGLATVIVSNVFRMTSPTCPIPAPATTLMVAPRRMSSPWAVMCPGSPPTIRIVRSPLTRLLARISRVGTSVPPANSIS